MTPLEQPEQELPTVEVGKITESNLDVSGSRIGSEYRNAADEPLVSPPLDVDKLIALYVDRGRCIM